MLCSRCTMRCRLFLKEKALIEDSGSMVVLQRRQRDRSSGEQLVLCASCPDSDAVTVVRPGTSCALYQLMSRAEKLNAFHGACGLQPKLFSDCVTLKSRILSSTYNPNRIIFSQSQRYTLRFIGIKKASLVE